MVLCVSQKCSTERIMPTSPESRFSSDDHLVESLVLVATGDLEPQHLAESLSLPLDDLIEYLDARPALMARAEAEAARMRSDPDFAVSRGVEGLNAVVAALAGRVKHQADQLAVGELATAGNLLEKLVGIAETRKAQAKVEKADILDRLPLCVRDDRPNPKTQAPRLTIWLIPASSPCWVDARDPSYQWPLFDWLETFAPLSPETGEPLDASVKQLLDSARCVDATGRILGGGP